MREARKHFPRDLVAALRDAWRHSLKHCRVCGEMFCQPAPIDVCAGCSGVDNAKENHE